MGDEPVDQILGEGRFLRLIRRDRWEYTTRVRPIGSVFIGALTDDGKLLLTMERRVPVDALVVGCPAGLVGDTPGSEQESFEIAARRELIEEAGFEARDIRFLTRGPTSPGMIDEVMAIVLATGLRRVGPGGGISGESIAIHEIPLVEAHSWLEARVLEGTLVDPKVYTVLYFLGRMVD